MRPAMCAPLWSFKIQMSSGLEMPGLVRISFPGEMEEQRGAGALFWGRTTQFASLISLPPQISMWFRGWPSRARHEL